MTSIFPTTHTDSSYTQGQTWGSRMLRALSCALLTLTLVACDDDDDRAAAITPTPTPPPAAITLSGALLDGPVTGGQLYAFSADTIAAVLEAANATDDRQASLDGASPIVSMAITSTGSYTIEIPGNNAGAALFLVFDNTGAEDMTFGDTPFNMESVTVLGDAGGSVRANVTPQSTMVAAQVRSALPLDAAGVATEVTNANANVVAAFATDATGAELLAPDADVLTETDVDTLTAAATEVGALVRAAAAASGLEREAVLEALALDALDGAVDGAIPASAGAASEVSDAALATNNVRALGRATDETLDIGSCSAVATLLRRACDIDTMDDFLEGVAQCQDGPEDEMDNCIAEARSERMDVLGECGEVHEARAELCEDLGDAVHDPNFGPAFADDFVDPLDIGDSVTPNPFLPLVPGNEWTYSSTFIDEDGEEVTETTTVTVREETKLIEGITCVVVRDVVSEDGEVIEDTDDWFAQDTDGNVWYCGEISQDFEYFDGDDPEKELVDLGGSWKSGREGAKAGILVPADPQVGDVIRNEVFYNDAEDLIEIASLTGDESVPAGDCDNTCLMVIETTPLEPDVLEHSFFKTGVGVVLKIDMENGARTELVSFTEGGGDSLTNAKLLVEHNATDEDTGFQGFADGAPWNQLTFTDPDGNVVLTANALGNLMGFGLTEFFFETNEPENSEVSIDNVVERFDERSFTVGATFAASGSDTRLTPFTHDLPGGPELLSPAEDATGIDPADTQLNWALVTGDIDDDPITIVGYQVIVEEDAPAPFPSGFAKPVFSVYLPEDATTVTVPAEFMRDNTCYDWEVLAIEESGNQTLSSSSFETGTGCVPDQTPDATGLKAAKILIEHNATDEDTGFQGFADGEPWDELTITTPGDADVVEVMSGGGFLNFGLTELFFETNEPPNADMSIESVLALLPEGTYTFDATLAEDGSEVSMTAEFTHDIPKGPVLVSPEAEAEDVDTENLVVTWEAVTEDLDGDPITIVGYQVIVEVDAEPEFDNTFAESVFSVYLPANATSVTVPEAFLEDDTDYAWEVLAIEESGNQTLSSSEFATASGD